MSLSTPGHRISDVKFNQSKKKTIGDTGVEFRYYSSHEYNKLSRAQKKELSAWRKDKENYKPPSHNISALQQQISQMKKETEAMRATIAALTTHNEPQQSTQVRQPLTNPLTQRVN